MRRLISRIPEGSAIDLAVFRIVVAVLIATSGSAAVATTWAAMPVATRVAPLGVGAILPHLPITPSLVGIVRVVMTLAAIGTALGLFTRASCVVMALGTSYVLLVPQLGGAVFHDHHLLWFATLLAASPCGDSLSVDAWIARRRGAPRPTRGRAHGAAIRVAWILIAAIFFFPGVHKLSESGLAWITSDNLRNQLWWKWAQDPSLVPSLRIDRHPFVTHACAASTVLLELSFPLLLLHRKTRAFAVVAALAFHQATAYFMGVHFEVLFACYVVFVPWESIARRLGFTPGADVPATGSLASVGIVGGLLVLGVVTAGAMGATQAYPFACYPSFQWMAGDTMPGLVLDAEHDDGTLSRLDRDSYLEPGPRGVALEWRLAGVYDGVHRARLDAFARRISLPGDVRAIRFSRVQRSVDPERRDEEVSRRFLYRADLRD